MLEFYLYEGHYPTMAEINKKGMYITWVQIFSEPNTMEAIQEHIEITLFSPHSPSDQWRISLRKLRKDELNEQ